MMTEKQFNTTKISGLIDFNNFIQLKSLYEHWFHITYPHVPYMTDILKFLKSNKPSGILTKLIINHLRWSGFFAERINTTGLMRNGIWTRSGSMTGSADISAIINGRAIKIEVKIKDTQNEAQKIYQAKVERAGAEYWLVHNFQEYIYKFNTLAK